VIDCAIRHFRKYNLDTLFIATNAPGRSAFNRVERRMAPLSKELCGLVLEHNHFGSHLDNNGKTVDHEKELQNFEHAGDLLAKIWGNVVFDGFPTIASYVSPSVSEVLDDYVVQSEDWRARHIRQGHYFLQVRMLTIDVYWCKTKSRWSLLVLFDFQIVKCSDRNCCETPRGSYFKIFPPFIPAPVVLNQDSFVASLNSDKSNNFTSLLLRLQIDDTGLRNSHGLLPFDTCCPSVEELVEGRTCSLCGLYFASIKSLKSHKRHFHRHSTLNGAEPVVPVLKIRRRNCPVQVVAQRQNEKLVLWTTGLQNHEHADWFDTEEMDGVPAEVLEESNPNNSLPVLPVDKYMTRKEIWENIKD